MTQPPSPPDPPSGLTDEAKAELRDAIRIVHEDKLAKFLRSSFGTPKPAGDPPAPKPGDPPGPPPPADPPTDPPKKKGGIWWPSAEDDNEGDAAS